MRTRIDQNLKRVLSICIVLALLFSTIGSHGTIVYAAETSHETVTFSLNSNTVDDESVDLYVKDSVHYISIEDLCELVRCSWIKKDDVIWITQGFWSATLDVKNQVFDDGHQTVEITILEVASNKYAVPALMFLNYFKAAAFVENDTLYCEMPEFTAWEALNVDYANTLVDIYELYGGEGNVTLSLTLDIIMDFIMGDMSTSEDYLSDTFLTTLKVDLYDYNSVQKYKETSQGNLYSFLHSDKGEEFVEAVDDVLSVSAEPTQWYIQYYYNAIEKSFVSLAYDAYEAGQHTDVTHYGEKFYEAFTEKNKTSDTAEKYFDSADYVMLFVSAAVDTAQQMKYTNATDNLIYNVMGQDNLNYLGITPSEDNSWFTVSNRYKNVLGVAATQLEAEAMQLFTDKLCWETLIGTGVSSAAGISGGAWTFSLNFARVFVEKFPLTSSSVEAFTADRRALFLSELQQNVYWVAMNTLQNMQRQWDNPEIYTKYIQALQLYCRTSIAMYENLIAMNDEFGGNKEYWRSLFQNRIDMLAVSLYQLTTLQDDGIRWCLPMELKSFATLTTGNSEKQLNQVKIIDHLNELEQIHTFQYDQSGCLIGTDIAYLYSNMPILNEEINCRYSYDSSGRLIQADRDDWWLEFSNERFDYDVDGKLLSYKQYWGGEGFDIPYSQVDYQYDSKGSLTGETHYSQGLSDSIEKDREYCVTCEYDKQNNLIQKNRKLSWMQPSTSVTKHTINGHDIWDCNYVEEYTYNTNALVTQKHTFYFFEDDETSSTGDVTTYQYDAKPFVLIRDQSDDAQMRIAINDAVGMPVWSIWVCGNQLITDEDGYVIAVTGDDNYKYEFIYDSNENEPSVESQENWAAVYIPVVEETIAESGVEMSQGILADMDNDKVPELILSYPWSSDGESWMWKYAFSVYDYEDGTLKTHAEDVSIGASAAAAGGSGYTSILLYNGNPMIVSYKSSGETSLGNGKYMNRTCKAVIYSFDGIAPHKTLEIETSGNRIYYSIDGITVSEEAFETEVNKYEYLTLDNTSAWVSIDCSYETMKLYDLLRYLQPNAGMGTASEPKITKAEAAQIAESLWGDYLQRRQGFDWKIFEGESAIKDGVEYYCFTLQSNFTYGSDDWEISEYLFINSVTGEYSNALY